MKKGKWKRWLIRSQWLPKAAGKTAHLQLSQYDVLILLPKKILKIRWKRKMGKVTNQVPMIAKRRNRWPASSPLSVATRLRPSVSVCTAVCTVHCALCTGFFALCTVYTALCTVWCTICSLDTKFMELHNHHNLNILDYTQRGKVTNHDFI